MNASVWLYVHRLLLVVVMLAVTPSPAALGQSCAANPGGMTAWWPGEGNAKDIQGSADATLRNGAAFAAGRVGQAFSLDGAEDSVSTPLDVQPAAMATTTWEAWVFPTRVNFGVRQSILCSDDGGFDRCVLIESGTSNFGIFTGTGVWQPASVTLNQWQHIAVVYTPTNILFYKNGVSFSLGAAPTGGGSNNRFTIGANPLGNFTENYRGLIDEVRVYDRQLTQAQIQAIYNAGPSGICRTLSINDVTVNETAGVATFTVTNVNAGNVNVAVAYATEDVTAVAGQDYASTNGTLTFSPGQFSRTITVPITNDLLIEANETFNVRLSSPSGATLADDAGVCTIVSDDAPVASSPGTAAPPGPVLATPSPSFNWSAVPSATRYGLYVSTASGTPVYTNTNVSGTSFTLPSPLNGGQYRWQVTAFSGSVESAPSTLYFQVPLPPPAAISPGSATAPGPMLTTPTPSFSWSPVANATRYGLYVSTAEGTAVYTNTNIGGTTFLLPTPLAGGQYRWRVTAFNVVGESAPSNTLYFRVPLAAPANIAPGNAVSPGPLLTTGAPAFLWSAVAGASGYRLYVTTASGNTIYTNTNVTGTSFTLPLPFSTGEYRWQVSAFGAIGESDLSPFFYFRVPPAPLRPITPGSSAAPGPLHSASSIFSWTAVAGATRYGLYITTAALVPVYTNVNVTATSFALPAPLPSDQYQWQVTAFTAAGESALSNPFFFQVPLAPPRAVSPGNTSAPGDLVDASALTFSWGAVPGAQRYGLYVTVAPHGEANVVFRRTNLTATSFRPPAPFGGGEYRWYVKAFNVVGDSGPGRGRYFRIQDAGAPAITTVVPFCDPADRVPVVRLAWGDTAGADAYVVLRDGAPLATTASVTFEDRSGVVAGRTYLYQVQALTATGALASAPARIVVPATICEAPSAADLVPSDLTLSPAVADPGSLVNVRLNLRNRGGSAAPPSYTQLILTAGSTPGFADPVLATIRTPGVSAGQSIGIGVSIRVPSTTPLGTYFVLVQADATHLVSQFDTSNDSARSALVVGPVPPCSLGCSTRVPARVFAYLPVRFGATLAAAAGCPTPAVTWDFGDGTSGEAASASHTYSAPGLYTWTMTAQGAESCRRSGTIEVTAPRITQIEGLVADDRGNGIAGATITIEAPPSATLTTTSGVDGSYATGLLAAGMYTATVSAPQYATTVEDLAIPGGMRFYDHNFRLVPPAPEVTVKSLTARTLLGTYPAGTFFLDTTLHPVELIADIDWAAHVPAIVTLSTPRIRHDEVKATGALVRRRFDMGLGVGPCGTISAIARAADGAESAPVIADYHVMSVPWFAFGQVTGGVRTETGSDSFSYCTTLELTPMSDDETEVKDDLPLVGHKKLKVNLKPSVEWEITSDGESSITAALEASTAPFAKFDHMEVAVSVSGGAEGTYDPERCQWDWTGGFGVSGSATVTSPTWTFEIPVGPIVIPGYANGSVSLTAEGKFAFEEDSVELDEASLELTGRGTLAAGIEDVAALEGWLELTGHYAYHPSNVLRHELSGTIRGGGAAYFWRWRYEFVLFDRTWSTEFGKGLMIPLAPRALALDRRRWSSSFPRTEHRNGLRTFTLLATNEFPQSMPDLAVSGSDTTVAWLSDLPSRSAINGAAVVASTLTNGHWSERVVVDDDGTADYRPRITATPAGTLLAWENMRSVLSDSATLEDAAAGSEISVAESAGFGTWSSATRLTDNGYLDRSPQIKGDSLTSAMVIWIANRYNNLYGSTTQPNELWFSTKSASGWSVARPAATLPYPVIRTALWFSHGHAIVVLTADMDGDPSTTNDRELLSLSAEDGIWSPPRRLTNDTIFDDAPSLVATAAGPRLFWLRGGELATCLNLDVASASVIHSPVDSRSLSSYRVTVAPDGTMAVVWAEASEFDSDLRTIRYDPAADRWGQPQQLTHDREIEKFFSAALDPEDRLLVAYDRAILARPAAAGGVSADAASAPSDEVTLLATDSAADLAAESLEVTVRNARPDDSVSGSVTVSNRGSVSVPSFAVDIKGDASDDILATVAVAQTLAPGETSKVDWSLTVPANVSRRLVAVVHWEGRDGDPSNDTAAADFGSPDLAIALARVELLGDDASVVTRVTNAGNLASQPASLVARSTAGDLLGTVPLGSIQPGESFDAVIRVHTGGPVRLVIDEKEEITDAQRSNNTRTVNVTIPPGRRRSAG